jgi:excisionase family DNA binding protein
MSPYSERTHDSTNDQTPNEQTTNRVTVAEAARLLGLSAEAVRMRIKRGTLASEKVGGTVYVFLDADTTRSNADPPRSIADQTTNQTTEQPALVDVLREQVAYLREQLDQEREANRENRRIIAGLVQRVPELEPASEPRESPEAATEATAKGGEASGHEQQRSRLYRFFFGP